MRLHWVTSVMLLAVLAREGAESIQIANFLHQLFGNPEAQIDAQLISNYVWPHVLHPVSQTIAGFSLVATIEFLARTLQALRAERAPAGVAA